MARPGPLELDREESSRERRGPVTVEFKTRIRESGFRAEAYRIEATGVAFRVIALVSWTHRRDTRVGPSTESRRVGYERLWVGEVRKLPVTGRVVAYDFTKAVSGEAMRGMVEARGLAAEAPANPALEHPLAREGRLLIEQGGHGSELRGQLVLASTGWVLDAPQSHALGHLERVLDLAEALSRSLIAPGEAPRDNESR